MDFLEIKEIYERALDAYRPSLALIASRDEIYSGQKRYRYGRRNEKICPNARNIVFEMIESQIDPSVPLPVVEPICAADEEAAKMIEGSLKADIDFLDLGRQNDLLERIVPIQGFGIFEVYIRDDRVKVRALHPSALIPQPGVCDLQEMDYFFICSEVTRRYIFDRYGVELPDGEGTNGDKNPEETVKEVVYWYKNDDGRISRAVFCGEVLLEESEDIYKRRMRVCSDCGYPMPGEICVVCGCEASEVRFCGEGDAIRSYEPDCYPFVIRENVPRALTFGGQSDIDVIDGQQEMIQRLYNKVEQKLLKGGSYIQIPANMQSRFLPDEEELKVIYSNPMDAPVSVHTIQPDISKDLGVIRDQIAAAQSTLGLNDSFQGKSDATALSGTAKRLLIEQANGRLQSKQASKHRAYRELYRMIYRMKLVFCDEAVPFMQREAGGKRCYSHFDKKRLLIPDGEGRYIYNDRFLFSVDAAGGLPHDRGYLYEQAMKLYQIGGFGQISTPGALKRLWRCLETVQFPLAAQVLSDIESEEKRA